MELKDYIRVIRKRWWIIVAAMVVGLAAAVLVTNLSPKVYQAETRLFVATPGAPDNEALMQGNDFTQQRVKSYVNVITTRKVLDPVIETLKLDTTAAALGARITATVPTGTVLIDVAVTDSSPRRAAEVADAVGKQVTNTVADLESLAGKPSPVKLTVLSAPTVPTAPISPTPSSNLGLGMVLGLLLGAVLALLLDLFDKTTKDEKDWAGGTDAAAIGDIAPLTQGSPNIR